MKLSLETKCIDNICKKKKKFIPGQTEEAHRPTKIIFRRLAIEKR
jgi:hypothetical protein